MGHLRGAQRGDAQRSQRHNGGGSPASTLRHRASSGSPRGLRAAPEGRVARLRGGLDRRARGLRRGRKAAGRQGLVLPGQPGYGGVGHRTPMGLTRRGPALGAVSPARPDPEA
eukprot:2601870-Pyramimonas_sp.AAC.1